MEPNNETVDALIVPTDGPKKPTKMNLNITLCPSCSNVKLKMFEIRRIIFST